MEADFDERLKERIRQYELAVAFAREILQELGPERAYPILRRAFEKIQVENARRLSAQLGSTSFEAFAEHNRRLADQLDNFEVLEITERQIRTRINRCVAYEAFAALGMPELCSLYCDSDYAYIKAFNPQMTLIRTQEIANGAEYCDHIWAREA